MTGKFVIRSGVTVKDVNEEGGRSTAAGVSEGNGGGPDRVEVVFDGFGAANALDGIAIDHGMADKERVGEREKVFVSKALRGEAQFNLFRNHWYGSACRCVWCLAGLWKKKGIYLETSVRYSYR